MVAVFGALLAVADLAVAWAVGATVLGGQVSLSVPAADVVQLVGAQMTLTAGCEARQATRWRTAAQMTAVALDTGSEAPPDRAVTTRGGAYPGVGRACT